MEVSSVRRRPQKDVPNQLQISKQASNGRSTRKEAERAVGSLFDILRAVHSEVPSMEKETLNTKRGPATQWRKKESGDPVHAKKELQSIKSSETEKAESKDHRERIEQEGNEPQVTAGGKSVQNNSERRTDDLERKNVHEAVGDKKQEKSKCQTLERRGGRSKNRASLLTPKIATPSLKRK